MDPNKRTFLSIFFMNNLEIPNIVIKKAPESEKIMKSYIVLFIIYGSPKSTHQISPRIIFC